MNENFNRLNSTRDVQREEFNRHVFERVDRNRSWWMKKHPGACPECGSHDGMQSWYSDELVDLDEWATDLDWYVRPPDTERVYTPCPHCGLIEPNEYEPIDFETVREFADDSMTVDYQALADEPHRGDEFDAAEEPAIQ